MRGGAGFRDIVGRLTPIPAHTAAPAASAQVSEPVNSATPQAKAVVMRAHSTAVPRSIPMIRPARSFREVILLYYPGGLVTKP